MKSFCLACTSLLLIHLVGHGQNFTFSPGTDYYGTLEMEMFTEHYVYVAHDGQDSAHITWRVIENTCPSEWDIEMCDWQHCYSGMPNTGNMNAVPVGGSGYLRLIVNPFTTIGSGIVRFWIFPTGFMDENIDVYFHFETSVMGVGKENQPNAQFYFGRDEIVINGESSGNNIIYDLQGRVVKSFRNTAGSHHETLQDIPAGMYICLTNQGNHLQFIKPY